MIVDIKKGNFAKGLINYHEKKVERGVAELILDSTFSRNKGQRIAEFVALAELNRNVRKDRYTHLSVSFSEEDSVDRVLQLRIAERYLDQMGYGDCPRLIYEHRDSKYRHFHIVTSTIDLSGKKILVYQDHFRNQELSRKIELEFGLKVTEYHRQSQAKLQELNASRYSVLKGIEKLRSDSKHASRLGEMLGAELLDIILSKKLSDEDIKHQINTRFGSHDPVLAVKAYIKESGAEYKTHKATLRQLLLLIKSESKNRDQFVRKCLDRNIYIRKIAGEAGSATFTYGFKDISFYLAEKDLPKELRHDYLFTGRKYENHFDEADQKKFVARSVRKALKNSSAFEDFELALREACIDIKYISNARGIYGITFRSLNLKKPIEIKGSDIGLSWNALKGFKDGHIDAMELLTICKRTNAKARTSGNRRSPTL